MGQAYMLDNLSSMGPAHFSVSASAWFGMYIYASPPNNEDLLDNKGFYCKM